MYLVRTISLGYSMLKPNPYRFVMLDMMKNDTFCYIKYAVMTRKCYLL